jgi:hypothetical protein
MDGQHTVNARHLLALVLAAAALHPGSAFAGTPAAPDAPARQQAVVVKVDSGFRWLDAGLGAVTALATVLLVYGLTLVVRDLQGRG